MRRAPPRRSATPRKPPLPICGNPFRRERATTGTNRAGGKLTVTALPHHRTCGSANTCPCRLCRGLSPPSECALPGAQKKAPREAGLRINLILEDLFEDVFHIGIEV